MLVFTREHDQALASLVKQLDQLMKKNEDKKLASFVNFLGQDQEKLMEQAKEFAEKHKVENVALVVPEDHQEGPENLELSKEAGTTVLIYRDLEVAKNYAFAPGELDKEAIGQILKDTQAILK